MSHSAQYCANTILVNLAEETFIDMQKAITIVDTIGDHNMMAALFLTRQILKTACTRMTVMPSGATAISIQMGGAAKWISLVSVLSMESAEM